MSNRSNILSPLFYEASLTGWQTDVLQVEEKRKLDIVQVMDDDNENDLSFKWKKKSLTARRE